MENRSSPFKKMGLECYLHQSEVKFELKRI